MVGLNIFRETWREVLVLSSSPLEIYCLSGVRMWMRSVPETSRKGLWLGFSPSSADARPWRLGDSRFVACYWSFPWEGQS